MPTATTCAKISPYLADGIICSESPLELGDAGVDATVADILKYARRDAKTDYVKSIVNKMQTPKDWQTAKNLFEYAKKRFSYKDDPDDAEFFTAPIHLLKGSFSKYRDCDDLAGILACLFQAAGLQSALKVIAWRRPEFTHIYNMVHIKSQGVWMPCDLVMDGMAGFGREKTGIKRSKVYKL